VTDNSQREKFNIPVQYLPGVGPKSAKKLAKLGVETIGDLIYYFPRKYLDYSDISKIADAISISKSEFLISKQIPNSNYQNQKSNFDQREIATPSHKGEWLAMTSDDNLPDRSTDNNFTIKARIVVIANKKTRRRGFTVTEAVVEDGTGTIKVVWFNQPYLSKMLKAGREIILNGKVKFDPFGQDYVMESPDWADRPKIVPVYRETDGVTTYYLSRLISKIKDQISKIDDFLPQEIIKQNGLLGLDEAIRILHEPADMDKLAQARRRMAFNELFLISLRGKVAKEEIASESAPKIGTDDKEIEKFIKRLPFEMTGDQKKAVKDILDDVSKSNIKNQRSKISDGNTVLITPMNRLLNGDVGSGKTIVAAIATYAVVKSGHKVMFMAPTEILAKQHFDTFYKLFANYDINVSLVTSTTVNQKSKLKNQNIGTGALFDTKENRSGKLTPNKMIPDILIGTHALLHLKEPVDKVGLVIVDEQHRFGVNQRQALREIQSSKIKNQNNGEDTLNKKESLSLPSLVNEQFKNINNLKISPHFLSMTATPIPRSLQLIVFGELDVSVISEKPKNRKPIKTRVVDEINRPKAYDFIKAHVRAGRQVFVVVPLIEESQNFKPKTQNENFELFEIDRKTVVNEYQKLSTEIFPDLRIGMLHGKMKAKEKEAVMAEFCSGRLDILVSTSVVEVGVDIPNASIMMIESAERFGLAQLHQFRGRVGRGEHQSFCFLFSSSLSAKALSRLKLMEEINDGFKLAESDLKHRGGGDMFGLEQSGFIDLKFADLSDIDIVSDALKAADRIVDKDPELHHNIKLKERLDNFVTNKHLE